MNHTSTRPARGLLVATFAALLLGAPACGGLSEAEPPLEGPATLDGAFVPIYRQMTGEIENASRALSGSDNGDAARHAATDKHFYLAVNKKELGQRWFLSAYLSQFDPGGVDSGRRALAGHPGGLLQGPERQAVRVRRRRRQGLERHLQPRGGPGGLPHRRGLRPLRAAARRRDYVLFDPAAGLNRFRLLTGHLGARSRSSSRSRSASARSPTAPPSSRCSPASRPGCSSRAGVALTQTFRVAGTLGAGLRRYTEGEGYMPTAAAAEEHYFRSPPKLVPNTGRVIECHGRQVEHPARRQADRLDDRRLARHWVSRTPASRTSTSVGGDQERHRELERGLRLPGRSRRATAPARTNRSATTT